MTDDRSTPTEDSSSTTQTHTVSSQPEEDALIPSDIPETCLLSLPPLQPPSPIAQQCPTHEATEPTTAPDNPLSLRRSNRKRKLSRHMQEPQEICANTPTAQPATSITHSGPQAADTGPQPEQGRHKRKTSSQGQGARGSSRTSIRRKRTAAQPCCDSHLGCKHTNATTSGRYCTPVTTPQMTSESTDTRLRVNTRTDKSLPTPLSTLCNDAQQTPLLPTSNTTSPISTQPPDSLYLSIQDSIALLRTRRCVRRPQRLCHSPTRGRSRIRSQPETSEEAPRLKRTRHAPSRTSTSPQPERRHRSKQNISQDTSESTEAIVLLSTSLINPAQQPEFPFDRGKS